jgi:hypothetical protein
MKDRTAGMGVTKTQLNFINSIVVPLASAWVDAFPDCSGLLTCLDSNVRGWKALYELVPVPAFKRTRDEDDCYVGSGTPRDCFKLPRASGPPGIPHVPVPVLQQR